ncbi:hypothetical protein AB0F43_25925 [Kribbella sp. NPDC023972]|uniref:hypothetical protein n=1 Tax=Kribbella sp. NPDC023972 TaxID=3154795 RepID=UPI0033CE335A
MDDDKTADAAFAARIEVTLSSLENLRSQLGAASRSEISPEELVRSLGDVWRAERPLLTQVAAAVLESLRVQALQQAYGWREQITRAIDAQAKPKQR